MPEHEDGECVGESQSACGQRQVDAQAGEQRELRQPGGAGKPFDALAVVPGQALAGEPAFGVAEGHVGVVVEEVPVDEQPGGE